MDNTKLYDYYIQLLSQLRKLEKKVTALEEYLKIKYVEKTIENGFGVGDCVLVIE